MTALRMSLLSGGNPLFKAGWDEGLHPRGFHGKWIGKAGRELKKGDEVTHGATGLRGTVGYRFTKAGVPHVGVEPNIHNRDLGAKLGSHKAVPAHELVHVGGAPLASAEKLPAPDPFVGKKSNGGTIQVHQTRDGAWRISHYEHGRAAPTAHTDHATLTEANRAARAQVTPHVRPLTAVTAVKRANGTIDYSHNGKLVESTRIHYTHASVHALGDGRDVTLHHKTEAAANRATYKYGTRRGTVAIQHAVPSAQLSYHELPTRPHMGELTHVKRRIEVRRDGVKVGEIRHNVHYGRVMQGRIQVGMRKDFSEWNLHEGTNEFPKKVEGVVGPNGVREKTQHWSVTEAKAAAEKRWR